MAQSENPPALTVRTTSQPENVLLFFLTHNHHHSLPRIATLSYFPRRARNRVAAKFDYDAQEDDPQIHSFPRRTEEIEPA